MSDTPRTDGEIRFPDETPMSMGKPYVSLNFARTLERDNAALRAEVERLRQLQPALQQVQQFRQRAETAEADVNRLNNLLRAVGWGQGEIDSAATIEEESEKWQARAETAEAALAKARGALSKIHEAWADGTEDEICDAVMDGRDIARTALAAKENKT